MEQELLIHLSRLLNDKKQAMERNLVLFLLHHAV